METNPTVVLVVAAALLDGEGRACMHRRHLSSVHGGLWEFPGGKVEPGETPQQAILREIAEELGVALDPAALVPVGFAGDALPPALPRAPHVILLYACTRWSGEPQCLEGEEIGWFALNELSALAMPPLDYPLAAQLLVANAK